MKPEAQVFEMTSPKKQYKIMQRCNFPFFFNALYVLFFVFNRHLLYVCCELLFLIFFYSFAVHQICILKPL